MAAAERTVVSRPWTVKLYAASLAASSLLLLLPEFSFKSDWWSSSLYVLLLLGVWIGSRVAWGLTLALDALSFVVGVVYASRTGFILVGLIAVWIGLLLAAPTQRWVGRRGAVRSLVESLPSEWRARPMTLRIHVGTSLAMALFSIVRDPGELAFPGILLTVLSLLLLRMLWDGSAGMWWFLVLGDAGYLALALTAGVREPVGWVNLAIVVASLMLLLHWSTRAWFNERIAARYP